MFFPFESILYGNKHYGLASLAPLHYFMNMNIGICIKTIRKNKGLNQTQLANLCGITVTYLSLIENDKKDPTLSLLRTIAISLQIPLPILLFMSLDDNDIADSKKELFCMIKPSIDFILQNLLEDVDSKKTNTL